MQIRFYAPEYLEPVADLLHEMSVYYNGSNASTRDVVRTHLVDKILNGESGVRLVIALDAERAVAMAAISLLYPAPKEKAQLFMKELFVVSSHRSKGIGEALMRFVAHYATSNSCSRFDWTVDTTNTDALRFYSRLGTRPDPGKLYFRVTGADLDRLASGGEADLVSPSGDSGQMGVP